MNSSQVEDSAYILSGIFPSLGTRHSIFQASDSKDFI